MIHAYFPGPAVPEAVAADGTSHPYLGRLTRGRCEFSPWQKDAVDAAIAAGLLSREEPRKNLGRAPKALGPDGEE